MWFNPFQLASWVTVVWNSRTRPSSSSPSPSWTTSAPGSMPPHHLQRTLKNLYVKFPLNLISNEYVALQTPIDESALDLTRRRNHPQSTLLRWTLSLTPLLLLYLTQMLRNLEKGYLEKCWVQCIYADDKIRSRTERWSTWYQKFSVLTVPVFHPRQTAPTAILRKYMPAAATDR